MVGKVVYTLKSYFYEVGKVRNKRVVREKYVMTLLKRISGNASQIVEEVTAPMKERHQAVRAVRSTAERLLGDGYIRLKSRRRHPHAYPYVRVVAFRDSVEKQKYGPSVFEGVFALRVNRELDTEGTYVDIYDHPEDPGICNIDVFPGGDWWEPTAKLPSYRS